MFGSKKTEFVRKYVCRSFEAISFGLRKMCFVAYST